MADEAHAGMTKATSHRSKGPLQRHPYLVLLGAAIVLLLVLILVIRFFIPILLLSSITALICYWKRLDVLKRAIGIAAIVLVALMWLLISGENADVKFVKEEARLSHYKYYRIGDAIEQFMRGTRWRAFTEGDKHYVEVRGRTKHDGKEVVLQFRVDRKNGSIQDEFLELDGSQP